jgi:two-component system LytT family response regulator
VIRALIVDDEPLALARARRIFGAEPGVAVVGECSDGAAAVAALATTEIDLLVLDIEMPERDGLDVAELAGDRAVIFVTAHEQYARRAFDADAVDYLLKPLDPDRVSESLARVRRRGSDPDAAPRRRIPARTGNRIRFVEPDAIDWIEAQGNYVALHAGGRVELVRVTLTELERRLDPRWFARIHRRLIVRIDRIRELAPRPSGEYRVRLADGASLLSGRTYRGRLAALARGA